MKTTRTPIGQLIEFLNISMRTQIEPKDLEKMFYEMLEFEKHTIAEAYNKANTNITQGVTMDGYEYYETTFDNQ
jgi:hypothetical protein